MYITIEELIHYTDEERAKWEKWFSTQGDGPLQIPLAGDKQTTVGILILHIFGPELRYVERLRGRPVTEYRDEPTDRASGILRSVTTVVKPCGNCPASTTRRLGTRAGIQRGTVPVGRQRPQARLHVLMHEIRHWARSPASCASMACPRPVGTTSCSVTLSNKKLPHSGSSPERSGNPVPSPGRTVVWTVLS